jgi:alginate O-acetyltransferase complex protein AlgI
MLFNSLEFVVFFALVYGLYIVLQHRYQNILLLAASLLFYGWWDWRFLLLLLLAAVVDYFVSHRVEASSDPRVRRAWLTVSLVSNLGVLGFFKYYNFFAENTARVLGMFGLHGDWTLENLVLPVGISFYTFQSIAYVIDVYRRDLKAARNFFDFMLFVSFFPQLVAGPISRATELLPQVEHPRRIRYQQFCDGLRLILIGFIMKLVVAENLAPFVKSMFNSPETHHGVNVLLGLYAAAFQIYGDFAGYSSIARGLSKLMGFELMLNFRQPYLATNPSDFWRRWHISLSTWLRDYLYIPLGGNRGGSFATNRNLMITMILGGLWHGAALNFLVWGIFHGGLLVLHRMLQKPLAVFWQGLPVSPFAARGLAVVLFFHVTCIGWLLFFAQRLRHVGDLLLNMIKPMEPVDQSLLATLILFGGLAMVLDLLREREGSEAEPLLKSRSARLCAYCAGVALLFLCGVFRSTEFIYFQF